jgi:phosphomannomutase
MAGNMSPKFGTSGLRGLVTELTEALVQNYTRAFIESCKTGPAIHVGQDLRPSSAAIASQVLAAIRAAGLTAIDCGVLPTPALAFSAMGQGHGAIMVTGSHIPADRNGLKFYLPSGEIAKSDELAITAALKDQPPVTPRQSGIFHDSKTPFAARYVSAFGADSLNGLRIGVYQHSSVARDLLAEILHDLGADVVALSRSKEFIPVDTEAVDQATRDMLADWVSRHRLDAVVSTDGDADRPMLAIAPGDVVPGDVLGALTSQFLGAAELCTPVSSNTMISEMGFEAIALTRIGSPYVIAAMEEALAHDPMAKVVGYEANGGYLLGFEAQGPAGKLAPLMTRDCVLPILAPLAMAQAKSQSLAELIAELPPRFTAADRLQGIATDASQSFLAELMADPSARAAFFEAGGEAGCDTTDGLRVRFEGGDVVHLRPSGNAPEFRCYVESSSRARANELLQRHLEKLAARLG